MTRWDVLELAGLCCLVGGVAAFSWRVGLVAVGVVLMFAAQAGER